MSARASGISSRTNEKDSRISVGTRHKLISGAYYPCDREIKISEQEMPMVDQAFDEVF